MPYFPLGYKISLDILCGGCRISWGAEFRDTGIDPREFRSGDQGVRAGDVKLWVGIELRSPYSLLKELELKQ